MEAEIFCIAIGTICVFFLVVFLINFYYPYDLF